MAKITYQDKVFLNKNEEIADQNKVNDTDLNEIKNVVNENAILNSLSEIGLSEITTLDAIVTAVPNGKTLQLYLSDANASTLYGTAGGTGNLPTNIAGILTVQKENGINWVYITYKTNLSIYDNDKAGIFYTTKFTGYREWTKMITDNDLHSLFKFQNVNKQVTIGGNGNIGTPIANINTPEGYTILGILPLENGYGDQWQVTYCSYQNQVYAYIKSYYAQQLTAFLKCTVIYIKSDYLS